MNFFNVCTLDELRENKRKIVNVGDERIVLFYIKGEVFAINAVCPHKGGSLGEGDLDDEEVICPLHCFMFNVKTGACLNHPGFSVRKYDVKVNNNMVQVAFF